jgi:hypothetical protein
MTLSALASIDRGTITPICLAVFKLTTSSNFVGCATENSAGWLLSRFFDVRATIVSCFHLIILVSAPSM